MRPVPPAARRELVGAALYGLIVLGVVLAVMVSVPR